MKTRITRVVGLALGLLSTEKIHAEHKSSYSNIYSPILTAKTRKPDLFSKKRTEYFTTYGQKVGVSVAKKPDLLGKTKTTFMDKYGKTLGTSTAQKPDLFGKTKTVIKDKNGRTMGTAITQKPDLFGNVKTTFHDKYSRKVVTAKEDLFCKKKTTYTGHSPFNFFKDSGKKK
jgi:hypothetical protein